MKHIIFWPTEAKQFLGHNLRQYKAAQKQMGIRFLQDFYGYSQKAALEIYEHMFENFKAEEKGRFVAFDLSLNPGATKPTVAVFTCENLEHFFKANHCMVSFCELPTRATLLSAIFRDAHGEA